MAELTSLSRSRGEEDESASASLRGATSPITGANRQTSGEKPTLFSERGYLNSISLSRLQRQRIKREIRKSRKLALTVSNITRTLAGGWSTSDIGKFTLRLPLSKCDEISSQCSTDEERTAALVREWLLRDPLASWRRIIDNLYSCGHGTHDEGDSIYYYAEELTDTSLTHSSLTKVLSSVATSDLGSRLDIPYSVSKGITDDCGDDEEQQREQHIYYYITCSPYALMGWRHIAGILHFRGEETAERAAKDYVQRIPEPSLVLENLITVLEGVKEWEKSGVVAWLHIPWSKQQELQQQYPVVAQHRQAYLAYFLTHHPAPCWRIIATALYNGEELGALEVVQKLYLRALTVSNITSTLAGIDWRTIGENILGLPQSKCDEKTSQCSTNEERTAALVREWLLRDPLASWRRIIHELHRYGTSTKEHFLGDSIIHYIEELTDTSLTHSNLTKVLSSVATDDLKFRIDIPGCVSGRIDRDCGDDEEQRRDQHIHYYITCSPHALMGWSHIAGQLHFWGEETAERAAKDYVQRAPEPSLILENLSTVMEGVSEQGLDGVGMQLHISWSKRRELQQQYSVVAQLKRAYSAYFLTHHPAPCWWIIATALYNGGELGALEVVQKLYLRDINLQNLCLEKISNWLKSTSNIDTLPLPAKFKVELKHRLFE